MEKTVILKKQDIEESIQRIAKKIVKKNKPMDALMDFSRPKKIEFAILIDRGDGDRELPIKANYVDGIWKTSQHETINVYLKEAGFEDHVTIEEKKAA
jgi:pyrimidine operon attenuation protein/uracil phosphoribosyltransferase